MAFKKEEFPVIKPSIGRVVLVYRGRESHLSNQWNEASIVYVHSDTLINVAGFDSNGEPFKEISISLRQDDIASDATNLPTLLKEETTRFACWMHYQRTAANKQPV